MKILWKVILVNFVFFLWWSGIAQKSFSGGNFSKLWIKKFLGVRTSRSFGSEDIGERGQKFIIVSISMRLRFQSLQEQVVSQMLHV